MKKPSGGLLWGVAAVCLWALLAAFSRSLLEMLGMFTAGGCIYIAGGAVCFFLYPPKKVPFSLKYHGLCGFFAAAYFVLYSVGIGLAENRVQAVEMGLINYLWPMLTLVFSIPFFKKRFSLPLLISGLLISFGGFALSSSVLSGVSLTPAALAKNFCGNPLPYLMMAGAAVSWALYSNVLSALDGKTPVNGMPWFMIISGLILLGLRFPFHEVTHWSLPAAGQLLFMALFPIGAGYFCWDRAMQTSGRESAILFSYMTPLFSAVGCALFLHVALPPSFYGACLMVIAGALLCRSAIRKQTAAPPSAPDKKV